jgi:toxin FitB
VTRYLLDTDIVSDVTKPIPSKSLLSWLAAQDDGDLHISTLTIAEIRRGILEKPAGRKRAELERWFAGDEGPQTLFAGRVLAFDEKSALVWAGLMAVGKARGRPRSALDTIVAAIAQANGCIVVSGNEKHYPGVKVVNPLRGRP